MKLKTRTLEKNIIRIEEERIIYEIKNKKPTWCIINTYNYLKRNYQLAYRNNEQYQGHPRLIENIFCSYLKGDNKEELKNE